MCVLVPIRYNGQNKNSLPLAALKHFYTFVNACPTICVSLISMKNTSYFRTTEKNLFFYMYN